MAFRTYRGDPVAPLDEALRQEPGYAGAHVAKALILCTFFERRFMRDALAALDAGAEALAHASPRDRAMAAAARALAQGDWHQGVAMLDGVLGMHAFGLEECNQYAEAESVGMRALEMAPEDCWAVHAVTHVMEMQGRTDEGARFLEARRGDWATADNGFAFHNWWHLALFHMDRGDVDAALAFAATGREPAARGLRTAIEKAALAPDANGEMTRAVGRDLVDAAFAFADGRYARAVDRIAAVRDIAARFGGSHAQRDLLTLTLVEAAHRAGQPRVAEHYVSERLVHKPANRWGTRILHRVRDGALAKAFA